MTLWIGRERDRVYDLTQPVLSGPSHGTAFPVRVTSHGIWYVTCDHVLKQTPVDEIRIGGQPACKAIRGDALGLDLALVLIGAAPSAPITAASTQSELLLAPLTRPDQSCEIPGCHRPGELDSRKLLKQWVRATVPGERADIIAADGALTMKGWRLVMDDDTLLENGYSGSPVLCPHTGRVFAVAAMRTDQGKGGIAICVSNLVHLLPDDLAGLLPVAAPLAERLLDLLARVDSILDCAQIRAIVRQSAPAHARIDLPTLETAGAYGDWLLNRMPWGSGRDALYDVLDWLEQRPDVDADVRVLIDQCKDLRLQEYPRLETTPMPAGPTPRAAPASLCEVIVEPLQHGASKGYVLRSYFHPADTETWMPGPQRDADSGDVLDPYDTSQVVRFVQALTEQRIALGLDGQPCIFQFRVPIELMHHPFEDWPKNRLKQRLGRDYPIVIASLDRDWDCCDRHWEICENRAGEPLRALLHCCAQRETEALSDADLDALLSRMSETPCLVLEWPPGLDQDGAITHLQVIAEVGVVALWPRSRPEDPTTCSAWRAPLGAVPIEKLPFAMRDYRGGAVDTARASPSQPLVLFWDNPRRSAKRPSLEAEAFHPGFVDSP